MTISARMISLLARVVFVGTCTAALASCTSSSGPAPASGSSSGISLGSGGSTVDPVSPDFALAYIRRKLPSANDPAAMPLQDDLRIQRVWNGPADVYLRQSASPSAPETNITFPVTNGTWDVRDLDVSFDGTKLIFSMRPPLLQNVQPDEQPTWAIYEYDSKTSKLRAIITDPIAAALGHDVGPHYLPDGRIVFSSTRQVNAKAVLVDQGEEQFAAGIEFDRNTPAFNLHVMNADGSNIHQISFNTGHDLDPSVMNDGRVVFSRWDVESRAGMSLYAVDPDGGNLQLLYGRNSHDTGTPGSVIQFTQPRSRQDGKLLALLIPFAGTQFGGLPELIDTTNFVENTQKVIGSTAAATSTAQSQAVINNVSTIPAPDGSNALAPASPGGRFSSAYPLWDGTNRMLVSWTQCQLTKQTLVVPCTTQNLADKSYMPAQTLYGIYLYDSRTNTQLPIVAPVSGMMFANPVVLAPRNPVPKPIPDAQPTTKSTYSFTLAAAGVGILDVKSVYDFDGVDKAPGGLTTVSNPQKWSNGPLVPRFLRIEKAVSLPDNEVLSNNQLPDYAFGVAPYMREMIGYAPIEPDGSVRVAVPTNIPFQISILDANGRRLDATFPRHQTWLQVRTGEIVTCNGCHLEQPGANGKPSLSHGRGGLFKPVNAGAPVTGKPFPGTALTILNSNGNATPAPRAPLAGETMAEYRAAVQASCVDPACAALPNVDLAFTDVWTPATAGTPRSTFSWPAALLGTAPPVPSNCETNWAGNCRVVIHYPVNIAPLWTTPRSSITATDPNTTLPYQTCTGCHAPVTTAGVPQVAAGGSQLDLTSSPAQNGACSQLEFTSFCDLLFPHPELNPATLQPVLVAGPPDPTTGKPTQVQVPLIPPMSGGGANSSASFFNVFAAGGAHVGWLSGSELEMISEWLDLGGQYYNNPFAIPPPAP